VGLKISLGVITAPHDRILLRQLFSMILPCLCTQYQKWQSNKLKTFCNWKAYRKNERVQRMAKWSCVYAS